MSNPRTKKRKDAGKAKRAKNSDGVTKSLILLQILNNDNVQTDDIRDYLRAKGKNQNIQTKNLVYKHLKQLEGDPDPKDGHLKAIQYIKRISNGHNIPDSYIALDSFVDFKNLYTFLKSHGYQREFIETEYYNEFLDTEAFHALIYIQVCYGIVAKLYNYFKNEDYYNKLMEESQENIINYGYMKILKKELENELYNNPSSRDNETIDFINSLKTNSVDDCRYSVDVIDCKFIFPDGTPHKIRYEIESFTHKLMSYYLDILTPYDDIPLITKLVKCSPSAIDYLLNLEAIDSTVFNQILIKYNVYRLSHKNYTEESPLTILLKSAFIQDFLSGKTIPTPELNRILDQIFIPITYEIEPKEADNQ